MPDQKKENTIPEPICPQGSSTDSEVLNKVCDFVAKKTRASYRLDDKHGVSFRFDNKDRVETSIRIVGSEIELLDIGAFPKGNGYGSRVIRALQDWASENNLDIAAVEVKAMNFFDSMGFEPEEEADGFPPPRDEEGNHWIWKSS